MVNFVDGVLNLNNRAEPKRRRIHLTWPWPSFMADLEGIVGPFYSLVLEHFGRIYIFGWAKKRHVPVRSGRKKRQESQVRSKSWRGVSNWQQPARASFCNTCNDFHPTPQNTILFDRESMTFNNSYQIIILSASASVPIHAVFLQNFPIWCDFCDFHL